MIIESEYTNIPKIYKRRTIDLIMYGFVSGMKSAMPSMSTRDCLRMFYNKCKLTEDDYAMETARVIYHVMEKEYIEKGENK